MGKDIESLLKLFLESKSTNPPSKIINILVKKDHRTYALVCLYFAYISLAKQSNPFSEKKKQGGSRMIAMPSSRATHVVRARHRVAVRKANSPSASSSASPLDRAANPYPCPRLHSSIAPRLRFPPTPPLPLPPPRTAAEQSARRIKNGTATTTQAAVSGSRPRALKGAARAGRLPSPPAGAGAGARPF